MISTMKVVLFSVLFGFIIPKTIAFDERIELSDLAGCRELRLNGANNNLKSFGFSTFLNNQAKLGEKLRMKFYAIGYDIDLYLKSSDATNYYVKANINGNERRSCKLMYTYKNPIQELHSVDCNHLTNSFDYTEFTLVIGSNRDIKFFEGNLKEPFLFGNPGNDFSTDMSYISFGRNAAETVDTRLFFDCPNKY